MLKKIGILLFLLLSFDCFAFMELKSNFYGSFMAYGRSDTILQTHNSLLFGIDSFKLGGFYTYESYQKNTVDTGLGATVRFGEKTFFELQLGTYQREFSAHTTSKGKGFMGNIIVGAHLGNFFGISLITNIKNISSGMDKRTMAKILPYFGLRVGF